MARYEYEEEYHSRRPSRGPDRRDRSPDYHSGGGGRDSQNDEDFVRESMHLEPIPSSAARPRSVPPPSTTAVVRRPLSPSRASSRSSSRSRNYHHALSRSRRDLDDEDYLRDQDDDVDEEDRHRPKTPMGKARDAIQDNFTNSTTGIGASLLGAVVGGLVARQASDAVQRHRRQGDRRGSAHDDGDDRARMMSTILGAVAGGLGANHIANRVEDNKGQRDRSRHRALGWDERDRDRGVERRDSWGRDGKRGGVVPYDREVDDEDEYDYVYDDRRRSDDRRVRRQRSDDDYRYRN